MKNPQRLKTRVSSDLPLQQNITWGTKKKGERWLPKSAEWTTSECFSDTFTSIVQIRTKYSGTIKNPLLMMPAGRVYSVYYRNPHGGLPWVFDALQGNAGKIKDYGYIMLAAASCQLHQLWPLYSQLVAYQLYTPVMHYTYDISFPPGLFKPD